MRTFFAYFTVFYYPDVMNVKKDSVVGKNMISKGTTMRIYFLLVLNWIKDNLDKDLIDKATWAKPKAKIKGIK